MIVFKTDSFDDIKLYFQDYLSQGYKKGDSPEDLSAEYRFILVENDCHYIDCEYQNKSNGKYYTLDEVQSINKLGRME